MRRRWLLFGLVALLAGCATGEPLRELSQATSCASPLIVIVPEGESGEMARRQDAFVMAELAKLGEGEAIEAVPAFCETSFERVRVYTDSATALPVHATTMSLAEARGRADVTCSPRFSNVYQPPLTIGGSGRVLSLPDGYACSAKRVP